ncbi:hypothetical protein EXIGLDRAFT_833613 [Exidia glandulosa HHB12029]|uniref:Cyanovirin-N domain-containing protein n=1 Tax=Exidia glandulosa HHB12029 TaxID=1314781 RepID=A0A165KL81_EXIGL|nr:hypothetical protein EXIGLDRAFT_833613 [Exidia glandulosa HHB12029]
MRFTAVLPVLAALAASAHAASGWASSCTGQKISGSILTANCINSSGLTTATSINLNTCLVNVFGQLGCGSEGQALKTCNDCTVSSATITCSCLKGGNSDRLRSSVDSNNCIGNRNGALTC